MTALFPPPEGRVGWPTHFEIGVRRDGEVVYVEPAGELDLDTSAELRDEVDELLAKGLEHVVIDLRRLTFIDCTSVRVLMALDIGARRHGARLSVIQGLEPARRVFALTATLDALPFIEAPSP